MNIWSTHCGVAFLNHTKLRIYVSKDTQPTFNRNPNLEQKINKKYIVFLSSDSCVPH